VPLPVNVVLASGSTSEELSASSTRTDVEVPVGGSFSLFFRRHVSSRRCGQEEQVISEESAVLTQAVQNLRRIILAGEHYRQVVAEALRLGTTETQALSYLAVHGESGQSDLGRALDISSSAATALVDRLERQGVAQRVQHPQDRRRSIVELTARGEAMVRESHRWLAVIMQQVEAADLETVSAAMATIASEMSTRTFGVLSDGLPEGARALPE
jgi:DNA-binding MarR family transcriptional regulator